jgi:hypothetical protein
MTKKYGALTSSQNPEEIANTVKGLVLTLSGVITLFATHFFNLTLTPSDVLGLATGLGAGAGAVWTVYGLIMKLVVAVSAKKV